MNKTLLANLQSSKHWNKFGFFFKR